MLYSQTLRLSDPQTLSTDSQTLRLSCSQTLRLSDSPTPRLADPRPGEPPDAPACRSRGVASLYAHTHAWPAALETAAWATCMHPVADDPGAGFTEQAPRLEFDQRGASLDHRGYRCIILMSDPLTPR